MDKINARKAAYEILREIEERESYSNIALTNYFRKREVSSQDRAFVTQLVYGVLERKITLDYYISKFSKTKLRKIHIDILHILRLAVYQIIYLDKTPDSAAVNEAVKLTKKVNFRSSGFVNGLLRQLVRTHRDIKMPNRNEDLLTHLSVKYSHNKWIVDLLLKAYDPEIAEKILEGNNGTPDLSIRVNTLKTTRENLLKALEALNIEVVKSTLSQDGLIIKRLNGNSLDKMQLFQEGHFIVQDDSSMLVADRVDAKPGERVLDCCSAPGGKTTHIGQMMQNKGEIFACDIYDHKLDKIKENAEKLGIENIQIMTQDATMYRDEWAGYFDKVLVDAPCSGLGIIRRKPEIKYLKSYDDVLDLADIQYEILNNNAKYVKIDGDLIYSTCTITEEENKNIIEKFIETHNNFEVVGDYEVLLPGVGESDGFFICKMKRLG